MTTEPHMILLLFTRERQMNAIIDRTEEKRQCPLTYIDRVSWHHRRGLNKNSPWDFNQNAINKKQREKENRK